MIRALLTTPSLLVLVAAVVMTLAQRLLGQLRERDPSSAMHDAICAVCVVPPGAACDRAFALAARASAPGRVRLHVLKFVRADEALPDVPARIRQATRLRVLPAAMLKDMARSRRASVRQAYMGERFVCIASHTAVVRSGWDEQAKAVLASCREEHARPVLVAPPAVESIDGRGVFMRPAAVDGRHLKTETVRFANVSDAPCPSLFWSSHFSFADGGSTAALPPDATLSVENEAAVYGEHLWRNAYGFFTAASLLVSGKEERAGKATVKTRTEQPSGSARTLDEYRTWLGIDGAGQPSRRTMLGLVPRPGRFECEVKYGSKELVQQLLLA